MKTFAWVMMGLALLGGVSCGLTSQQRAELIDSAVKIAGDRAEAEAKKLLDARIKTLLEEMRAKGAKPEELTALEAKLRGEGEATIKLLREEAESRARELADKNTPPADPQGGGWLGKLIEILAPLALLLLRGLKKEDA